MSTLTSDKTRQNELHALDYRYAVQITVYLLKPIGAWPLMGSDVSLFKIVLQKLSMMIVTSLQLFVIVPWIATIIVENWDIMTKLRAACPLIFCITSFARYILLLWHKDRLKSCVNRVADDWQHLVFAEDREIMLANAKRGRTFGIVSVIFMYTCGVLFYIQPLTLPPIVTEDNVTVRLHPLPCVYFLFDPKDSPVYEIIYCLQSLSGFTLYSAFCGICSLMAHFVTHICGQCDVLSSFFEETVDGGKHNVGFIDDRIATAVNQHLRLLKLVSNVSGLFTEICLAEFINSSCNICLLGYFIITDLNNNGSFVQIFMYVFALASIIFNLFIFCYIGDLLAERCEMVGFSCYGTEWYRMPSKKAIEMIMPITISRYPVTITAGKMITMTLSTFSDILKTSMAYFNLLREFA